MRNGVQVVAPRRIVRAASFGLISTLLAAVGHAAAGAGLPGPLALIMLGMLLATAAWPLLGRERHTGSVVIALALAQLIGHGWFVALHAGHGTQMAADQAGSASGDGAAMLAWHSLATVVAALWLRLGERRVWATARRLALRLLIWARAFAAGMRPLPGPAQSGDPRPALHSQELLKTFVAAHGWRGPPAWA